MTDVSWHAYIEEKVYDESTTVKVVGFVKFWALKLYSVLIFKISCERVIAYQLSWAWLEAIFLSLDQYQ